MKKDIIKSLIAIKQSEIPFDVIDRDVKLPLNRKKSSRFPVCVAAESPHLWK